MRRVKRRKDRASHEQRRERVVQVGMGLFLALIMITSLIEFGRGGASPASITYEGVRFEPTSKGFTARLGRERLLGLFPVGGREWLFHYAPLSGDARNLLMRGLFGQPVTINAEDGAARLFRDASIVALTFDPGLEPPASTLLDLARFQLSRAYEGVFSGVLENSSAYPSLPVITCDESVASSMPVIRFLVNNDSSSNVSLTLNGSCITVRSGPAGLLAAKDYLILTREGVVPIPGTE